MGSASAPGESSEGPMARTITFFGCVPVTMNPPMSAFSPVSTRRRVEMFPRVVGIVLGVGEGVAVAVGSGDGVGVVGVPVGVGVGVGGPTVGVGVGVPGVAVAVGEGVGDDAVAAVKLT